MGFQDIFDVLWEEWGHQNESGQGCRLVSVFIASVSGLCMTIASKHQPPPPCPTPGGGSARPGSAARPARSVAIQCLGCELVYHMAEGSVAQQRLLAMGAVGTPCPSRPPGAGGQVRGPVADPHQGCQCGSSRKFRSQREKKSKTRQK